MSSGTMRIGVEPYAVELVDDDRVCAHARADGDFEPETMGLWTEECARVSATGSVSVAVDVGAYSGLYAIAAAKAGVRSIAIEPMPAMVLRLARNAQANGVAVHVVQGVATDAPGRRQLHYNPAAYLTSGASIARTPRLTARASLDVEAFTLDDLLGRWGGCRVVAIKIDAERAEAEVLRGARGVLMAHAPLVIVEVLGDAERRRAVEAAGPTHEAGELLDGRNLVLRPRRGTPIE